MCSLSSMQTRKRWVNYLLVTSLTQVSLALALEAQPGGSTGLEMSRAEAVDPFLQDEGARKVMFAPLIRTFNLWEQDLSLPTDGGWMIESRLWLESRVYVYRLAGTTPHSRRPVRASGPDT